MCMTTLLAPPGRILRSHTRRLFSIAVFMLVLLLAAYLGRDPSFHYVIAACGLATVVVLIHKPELGLVLLLFAALSVPFTINTGTQTPLHLALIVIPLLLAIWVCSMLLRKSVHLVLSIVNLPLVCLATSVTISLIVGNLPWSYFARPASLQSQLGGWAIFVFSAVVFVLVGNQIKDLVWLKVLTFIFLAIGGSYVVGRIVSPLAVISSRIIVAPGAVGSLLWVWLVALAGGQALFNRSLRNPVRLVLITLASVTLVCGYFLARSWISGWLPPLVAAMTLIWLRSWRVGLLVTIGGFITVLVRDPSILYGLVGLKQYSIDTRLEAWEVLFQYVIPLNPILGLGPANYYFYTPLFPILGWYVSFNSHNQYVDLLAQTGAIGLVIFGWLMASIARVGWDLRLQVTDEFARGYVYSCLGGLAGTLWAGFHGDWFIPFVYNIGMTGFRASMLGWLFLGGLVAIEQMVKRQSTDR